LHHARSSQEATISLFQNSHSKGRKSPAFDPNPTYPWLSLTFANISRALCQCRSTTPFAIRIGGQNDKISHVK
jgi:hypothetical protein